MKALISREHNRMHNERSLNAVHCNSLWFSSPLNKKKVRKIKGNYIKCIHNEPPISKIKFPQYLDFRNIQ